MSGQSEKIIGEGHVSIHDYVSSKDKTIALLEQSLEKADKNCNEILRPYKDKEQDEKDKATAEKRNLKFRYAGAAVCFLLVIITMHRMVHLPETSRYPLNVAFWSFAFIGMGLIILNLKKEIFIPFMFLALPLFYVMGLGELGAKRTTDIVVKAVCKVFDIGDSEQVSKTDSVKNGAETMKADIPPAITPSSQKKAKAKTP